VPGALAEDDLEKVEIPPDIQVATAAEPLPSTSTLSTASPAASLPNLNGEIPSVIASSTSGGDQEQPTEPVEETAVAEDDEEEEAEAAAVAAAVPVPAAVVAGDSKKVTSPKLKINTPKKPKPSK
jgi:hypothetical protein